MLLLKGILPISIHVPREGDDQQKDKEAKDKAISIHVPREGDDVTIHGEYG